MRTRTGRLTRYLLEELWTPTLLSISLWVSLLLMNQFFLLAQMGLQQNVPVGTLGFLLLLSIPKCLLLAIPMGTLLGSLIGMGRLSADHEFLALQNAGLGPSFLLRPLAYHGLLFTAISLSVYWVIQPAAVLKMREINAAASRVADLTTEIRPRVFFTQFPGVVVFVREVDPRRPGVLDGVLVYKSEPGSRNEQITVARSASVSRDRGTPGDLRADFRDGVTHRFRSQLPEGYQRTAFERGYETIPLPEYLKGGPTTVGRAPGDMALGELLDEFRLARDEKDAIIRPLRMRAVAIEAQSRLALPFACLFLAILAAPLGVTRVRSGKGAGFALSIGVILVYWLIHTTLQKQALEGRLPVVPALWSANGAVVLLAVGAYARVGASRAGRIRESIAAVSRRILDLFPTGSPTIPAEGSAAPSGRSWIPQIDRYIGATFLRLFALSLGFCWLVVLLFEIKSLADSIPANSNVGGLRIAAYFVQFTPGSLGLAVPVAALVGAVVSCTLFARNGEMTAMRALGMSAHRVVYPILILTLLLSATAFLVQDRIAPETNRRAQSLKDDILQRAPRTYGAAGGRWIFGSEGRLYHYRLFDPELRQFRGLSVFTVDLEHPDITSHTTSPTVRWDGSGWKAEGGWSRSFRSEGSTGDLRILGPDESLDIDPPDHFSRRERTMVREHDLPEQLSLADLGTQVHALQNSGFDTTKLRVAWHVKIARGATPVVMVILGLPFAFRVGRRGSMYGVGVALLLVLAYWAAFAITNALGHEGVMPAAIAAWAPNILFAGLGAWMMTAIRT